MSPQMRERVMQAREEARAEDVDADIVAFLLFSEILRVVGAVPELRAQLGARGARHWHRMTSRLVRLRNAVMHPTRELVGRESSVATLVTHDALLRGLLRRLESPQSDDLPIEPVSLTSIQEAPLP
jgi:hypothetical protein